MTPGLVWGMNLKCPWITFGVKNPCGMTFPEHFLRVAGFGQMTHPNSVISTQPSSMMLGYGQASNFWLKSTYWKGFSEFLRIGSQYSQNIYSVGPSGAKQNMKKPYLYQKMDPKSKYISDPELKLSDVNYEIPLGHGEISQGCGVNSLGQSLRTDCSDPLLFYRCCKYKSLLYFCVQLFIWQKVFKKFYTCVKMTFVIQKLHLIASSCSRESYSQLNQHTM